MADYFEHDILQLQKLKSEEPKKPKIALFHLIKNKPTFELLQPIIDEDINQRDSSGNTILHYAIEYSIWEIIKFLLDNNADPFLLNNKENNIFLLAARRNDEQVFNALWDNFFLNKKDEELEDIFKMLTKTNVHGMNILHYIASNQNASMLKMVLDMDIVDVKQTNCYGEAPLNLVCFSVEPCLEMVKMLLDAGADPHYAPARGKSEHPYKTPWQLSVMSSNDALKELFAHVEPKTYVEYTSRASGRFSNETLDNFLKKGGGIKISY